MNHTSAWVDPMQERFDKTAASDAAYRRLTRDYPRTTQVEPADHLPVFAAMLAGGAVLAWLAVRRILGWRST